MLMRANMACISSLTHDTGIRPDSAVSVDLVPAICFVVFFALLAGKTGVDLCPDSNALPGFDERYFWSDTYCEADYFVADAEGEVLWPPAARDGVYIAAADTACLDLDVDVVVVERFGGELF